MFDSNQMTTVLEHRPYERKVHGSAKSRSKSFGVESYSFEHFESRPCLLYSLTKELVCDTLLRYSNSEVGFRLNHLDWLRAHS